jgi:alkylation response protein AidB-like acyl-CoA dehydrogenase
METKALALIAELDKYLAGARAQLDSPEGFSRDLVDTIHDLGIFRVFIRPECGGVYERYSSCLSLVSTAAYHSLELSLLLGITSSLFVLPVGRYASPAVRQRVLADFQQRRLLAGMMMTEPDFGTNIMGIETRFRAEGSDYRLQGTKHWAGLSGNAEYWLVSARKERDNGALGRDIDFFIVRSDQAGFEFRQSYPAAGLTSISYGLTTFDVAVPAECKLCGPDTNIRVLYDILNRSRISISAISSGASRRLLEEAIGWTSKRAVFGKPLIAYEQVQHRLAGMQAISTICSSTCSYVGSLLDAHESQEPFIEMLAANVVKVTTSDLLQMSAQSAVQLYGGHGFRKDHFVGKAFVDTRPFQIFEGSNDVLYEAIAAQLIGEARKLSLGTLGETLARHPDLPPPTIPDDTIRKLSMQLDDSQVDRILFGKIISRYAVIGIIQRAATSVSPELLQGAVTFLQAECEAFQNERNSRFRCRFIDQLAPQPQ